MNKHTLLLVVSYYDKRCTKDLKRLLHSVQETEDTERFDVAVVVNSTTNEPIDLKGMNQKISVLYRENSGMNIGAWEYGWRSLSSYQNYIFLQDECVALRTGWLHAYLECLSNPNIGLIGESLSWDLPWSLLRDQHVDLIPGHEIDGKPANRVDTYIKHFRDWSIDPGETGAHLQALIWAARRETLQRIEGFPEGRTKAECIASEIGVSRKVISVGKRVCQIDSRKFSWFSHPQWDRRGRIQHS